MLSADERLGHCSCNVVACFEEEKKSLRGWFFISEDTLESSISCSGNFIWKTHVLAVCVYFAVFYMLENWVDLRTWTRWWKLWWDLLPVKYVFEWMNCTCEMDALPGRKQKPTSGEETSRDASSFKDDEDGHLIYRHGDMLNSRCTNLSCFVLYAVDTL